MITYRVDQGSIEWQQLRIGIPTASRFSHIITPKTHKLSASATPYLHEKLAEWLLGEPADAASSGFMDRGSDLEAEAIRWYEFTNDMTVDRPGFILRDDRLAGCSPDGLVGDDGGLEIKCLSASNHVGALLGSANEYPVQIQGCMWLCERTWWTRLYYNPAMPPVVVRVERDDSFIALLAVTVNAFIGRLQSAQARLLELGCKPRPPKILEAVRRAPLGYGAWHPPKDAPVTVESMKDFVFDDADPAFAAEGSKI